MNEQLKSLDLLGKEIKAALDQADKAYTRANDLKLTAGRMLLEAKGRIKKEGGKWLDYLSQHQLDKRRSQEVMKIAKGETTLKQMRAENANRQEQHRKESALCNALSTSNQTRLVTTSVKGDGEEGKEVQSTDWETDPRTRLLKQDNQRLTSQVNQLNRRNDSLKDEIDELKGQLGEYRQIRRW